MIQTDRERPAAPRVVSGAGPEADRAPRDSKASKSWLAWHRQRWALRQHHSCPLRAEFRQWLEATAQTVLPKTPVGKVLQYVLPRWLSSGVAKSVPFTSSANALSLS